MTPVSRRRRFWTPDIGKREQLPARLRRAGPKDTPAHAVYGDEWELQELMSRVWPSSISTASPSASSCPSTSAIRDVGCISNQGINLSKASSTSSAVHSQSDSTEMSSLTRRAFVQAGAASAAAQVPSRARPNVLFIMLDQWRLDCLGANGNGIIQTPHLDELASRSANFTPGVRPAPGLRAVPREFLHWPLPAFPQESRQLHAVRAAGAHDVTTLARLRLRNGLRWEAALPSADGSPRTLNRIRHGPPG